MVFNIWKGIFTVALVSAVSIFLLGLMFISIFSKDKQPEDLR